jgi:hypothetical protein
MTPGTTISPRPASGSTGCVSIARRLDLRLGEGSDKLRFWLRRQRHGDRRGPNASN